MSNQHFEGRNPQSCYHRNPGSYLMSARIRTLCKAIRRVDEKLSDIMLVLYDCEKDDINDFFNDLYAKDKLRSCKNWESYFPIYPIHCDTHCEKENTKYMYTCLEDFVCSLHNNNERVLKIYVSCVGDLFVRTEKRFYYILALSRSGLLRKEMYAYTGMDEFHIMRLVICDRKDTVSLGKIYHLVYKKYPMYDYDGNFYDRKNRDTMYKAIKSIRPYISKAKENIYRGND